jgi:hypothetical protein
MKHCQCFALWDSKDIRFEVSTATTSGIRHRTTQNMCTNILEESADSVFRAGNSDDVTVWNAQL